MTIKEKFKKATSQWFDTSECEEIAESEIIQFAAWYTRKVITSNFDILFGIKEAFEIYKKEFNK